MKKIKKYFRILKVFLFCLQFINDKDKITSIKQIWEYSKKWEEGKL